MAYRALIFHADFQGIDTDTVGVTDARLADAIDNALSTSQAERFLRELRDEGLLVEVKPTPTGRRQFQIAKNKEPSAWEVILLRGARPRNCI
jgi:hypothetical protein